MRKIMLLIVTVLASAGVALADGVDKQSYTFANHDGQELVLDYYSASDEVQPCLVYVFGGAFLTGSRHEPTIIPVYEYFAQQGWKVVAIDYRLGLKPLVEEPDVERGILELRSMLVDAVDMATEDLVAATNYLLKHAKELAINPKQIVVLGSSAGAITACQTEYAICNGWDVAASLPDDFNYAGVISMAGAILTSERRVKWQNEPCPIMMLHGNADKNVPYDKISLFGVRMFGSQKLAASLDKINAPYWFYDANNVGHSLSWRPMFDLRPEMLRFMNQMAVEGQNLQIHQTVDDLALEELPHKLSLKDFIEANTSVEPTAESAAEMN